MPMARCPVIGEFAEPWISCEIAGLQGDVTTYGRWCWPEANQIRAFRNHLALTIGRIHLSDVTSEDGIEQAGGGEKIDETGHVVRLGDIAGDRAIDQRQLPPFRRVQEASPVALISTHRRVQHRHPP